MVVLAMVKTEESTFQLFWELFPSPRRSGKAMCRSKWDAITSPTGLRTRTKDKDSETFIYLTLIATPEEIIDGLKRSCDRWKAGEGKYGWKDEGKYIPMPITWLNQGRWQD